MYCNIVGTSTDVSRYAGEYEHVFETTTAGVTIQAPQVSFMLCFNKWWKYIWLSIKHFLIEIRNVILYQLWRHYFYHISSIGLIQTISFLDYWLLIMILVIMMIRVVIIPQKRKGPLKKTVMTWRILLITKRFFVLCILQDFVESVEYHFTNGVVILNEMLWLFLWHIYSELIRVVYDSFFLILARY